MLFHLWTMPGVPEIHKRIRIYGQSAANSIKSWGIYEITHSMGYADAKPDTLERSSATFLLRYPHSVISATFETLWSASSLFSNVLLNIQKLRNKEHDKKRKNHRHCSDLKETLGINYAKPRIVVDRSFYDKFIYFVRIENSKRSIDVSLTIWISDCHVLYTVRCPILTKSSVRTSVTYHATQFLHLLLDFYSANPPGSNRTLAPLYRQRLFSIA